MARKRSAGSFGEFLCGIFASARDYHRREIPRAEMSFDEIAGVASNDAGSEWRHIQIVEHDDVDTPRFDVAVRTDIGRDRAAAERKRLSRLPWKLDIGERLNRLRLAVFEHLEVFGGEAGNEIALCVFDRHVDVDDVDADFEGGLLGKSWRDQAGCDEQRDAGAAQRVVFSHPEHTATLGALARERSLNELIVYWVGREHNRARPICCLKCASSPSPRWVKAFP